MLTGAAKHAHTQSVVLGRHGRLRSRQPRRVRSRTLARPTDRARVGEEVGPMSEPHYTDGRVTLWLGDCLDVLRQLDDASVDAVCTDPPYALGFMGRKWDTF